MQANWVKRLDTWAAKDGRALRGNWVGTHDQNSPVADSITYFIAYLKGNGSKVELKQHASKLICIS